MLLAEPMTVITDWVLAALAVVLGVRLLRNAAPLPRRLVALSFFLLAAAALVGGALHGWAPRLGAGVRETLWRSIYAGIGLAILLLLAGVVLATVPARLGPFLVGLLGLRFAVFLALAFGRDFGFVMGDLVLTLLVLAGFGAFFTLARPRTFAPWLLGGVLVSFVAALVQTHRLAPHALFNHNDLFHVIQMGGLYLFYRAALDLPDRP